MEDAGPLGTKPEVMSGPTEVGGELLPGGARAGQKMPSTGPRGRKPMAAERERIGGMTFIV
jgi:hypothetical protein